MSYRLFITIRTYTEGSVAFTSQALPFDTKQEAMQAWKELEKTYPETRYYYDLRCTILENISD